MKKIFQILFFLILSTIFTSVMAQGSNPFAPTSAMDTMNEAPVGGGISTGTYMDRARDVGIVEGQPQKRESKMGGGDPRFAEFAMMEGGGPPGGMRGGRRPSQPGVQATPVPTPKQIRVLTGSRVQCAVSGEILEDIIYRDVPELEKENYYDDATHGDAEAGDGTYTNITVRNDVMSAASHEILQRLLTLMENIEDTEPMDFFRLNVVTSEPLSSISKQIEEEQDRDIKLSEWNDRFVRMFRVNENNPQSEFYPLYIPPSPSYPSVPLPGGFQPIIPATPTPESESGRSGFDVMGEGRGGHMGNYYDRGKAGKMGMM